MIPNDSQCLELHTGMNGASIKKLMTGSCAVGLGHDAWRTAEGRDVNKYSIEHYAYPMAIKHDWTTPQLQTVFHFGAHL